jgi:hypothetical protein
MRDLSDWFAGFLVIAIALAAVYVIYKLALA